MDMIRNICETIQLKQLRKSISSLMVASLHANYVIHDLGHLDTFSTVAVH